MPRGGRRTGTKGRAYANRRDLNISQVPTGLPYGERQAREQALRALPLPSAQSAAPVVSAAPGTPANRPVPIPLDAPSERPDEPLTEGLRLGAGRGPEVLGLDSGGDDTLTVLRGLYRAFPNDDLRRLIAEAESRF